MFEQFTTSISRRRIQLGVVALTFFLFRTGVNMFDTTVGPYLLRAVCEKKFPNNITICSSLDHLPEFENEVREEAGIYFIVYRLFINVPSLFSGLFFGAWSDRRGRKIPMLIPCIGIMLSAMIYICSLYMGSKAIWVALLGTLPQSIFGNTAVAAMAVNSYVASLSDISQRTKYISLFDGISALGQAFGAVLAGTLKWELLTSFSVVIGFQLFTAVLIALLVRETEFKVLNEYVEHRQDQNVRDECYFKIFDGIRSYTDLLRDNDTGSFISVAVMYLVLEFIYGCDTNAIDDVFLMYVTASPLSWTKSMFSYYVSFKNIAIGISLLAVLPLLSHVLKFSDSTVVTLGIICNVVRYVGIGLSNKTWMIYGLLTAWSLALMTRSCIWSILSKAAIEHEHGKMFINFAIIDTLSKCIGSTIYVYLYSATVEICPALVFYVMGGINVIIFVIRMLSNCLCCSIM